MKTRICMDCAKFSVKDVTHCTIGHKPRYYMHGYGYTQWGEWKRKCGDYVEGTPIGQKVEYLEGR